MYEYQGRYSSFGEHIVGECAHGNVNIIHTVLYVPSYINKAVWLMRKGEDVSSGA